MAGFADRESTLAAIAPCLREFVASTHQAAEAWEFAKEDLPPKATLDAFAAELLHRERQKPRPRHGTQPMITNGPSWLAERTILLVRQGSHAYGTARPNSDLDLRGVALAPPAAYLGFRESFEQFEQSQPQDLVIFELRKFMQLGANCNPGIFEMLWVEPEDIVFLQESGEKLLAAREAFLSKRARFTFAGYAKHQLQRIRNHRAWLLDPPKAQPTRGEFDLPERTVIPSDQLKAAEAAIKKKLDRWQLNVDDLDPARRRAVLDAWTEVLAEMSLGQDERWRSAGRILGYDDNFLEILDRERRYEARQRDWQQYRQWQQNRNPDRTALEARFGYDTKHAMHLVRVLRMGREILEQGRIQVRRPDAAELLAIRDGAWSYDDLMAWVEAQDRDLDRLLETTTLPDQPDFERLERLCWELIGETCRW